MAEEQKNPEEENIPVGETVEEADSAADQIEAEIDAAPEVSLDEDVQAATEDTGSMEEAESVAIVETDHEDGHSDHHYTDEVVLPYFGSIGTMPGGIYTFIFLVLGAVTIIEVLVTVLIPENAFTIAVLVLLSLSKAYLVVMYYMHLNRDNPIFRLAVLLPLAIVLLSTLYLLGVPAGAGLGYN